MPVWITLKSVPDKYRSSAQELAQSLGTVVGKHRGNQHNSDQKFCVTFKMGVPSDLTLGAVNPVNPVTGETTLIKIDYNNLPI